MNDELLPEAATDDGPVLLVVLGTPVKAQPDVMVNLLGLWGGATALAGRRRPERSWPARLAVGAIAAAIWATADFGHALAHIASARAAGAPMDEVRISQGMPRTIYADNDVPPRVHIIRSLGGPIFNTVGLLIGLLMRAFSPAGSVARELAGDTALAHSLLLGGSLAPLPIVDGGVMLKWGLVEGGRTPEEADRVVQTAGVITGAVALGAGAALATRRRWLAALGLIGAGVAAIAATLNKLH
ncbi:MAG TPA: hypothetical protein VLE70_13845 [Anaerolineae bacterium]|jgi:hypothetical protein|nr:hypothetical protein [Anaerolineae bacterium]